MERDRDRNRQRRPERRANPPDPAVATPSLPNRSLAELFSQAQPSHHTLRGALGEPAARPVDGAGLLGRLIRSHRSEAAQPVIARQAAGASGLDTPGQLYEDIGPLASAWSRTHPAVEQQRANLSRLASELQAAPPDERAALFDDEIAPAEKELATALREQLTAVTPPFERLTGQQLGGAAARSTGLRTMLKPYADEIDRSRRELDALGRVFATRVGQRIEEKYRVEVKPIPGGGCMTAMYKGFEVLYSPADSKALLRQVYRDAQKVLKKTGRDTNNVDRILETLRTQGRAGPARVSRYDRRTQAWSPTVESQVTDMIVASIPGWFFFGLSVSGAYHTVTLAVDTTGTSASIYWLDQFTRGFTKDVTGRLDERMQEAWLRPSYGYTTSKVWPIIPEPASSVPVTP